MKRDHSAVIILLISSIVFLGGNAWGILECSDTIASPTFGGIEILRLSASDNAHAEFPSSLGATNYPLAIRCRESGGTALTVSNGSTNTFIRLSSQTNAHAEVPGQTAYSQALSLSSVTGSISFQIAGAGFPQNTCDAYDGALNYTEIVRLSSTTNAHAESPYSGTPTKEYAYSICGAFSASGSPSYPDIIDLSLSGLNSTITTTSTMTAVLTTQKLSGDPAYTDTRTLLVASLCDLANTDCSGATDAFLYAQELYEDPPASPIIFLNRVGVHYGNSTSPYSAWPYPVDNGDILTPFAQKLESQTVPGIGVYSYPIDATALGLIDGHQYRFQAFALPAQFNHTLGVNQDEALADSFNNYQQFDFTIDDAGGPGPTTNGAGGDIFILKNIDYSPNPPIEGKQFNALITVQNKRYDLTPTGVLNVIIRDGQGNEISGFDPATYPITFPTPASGTTAEWTETVTIEFDSGDPGAFVPGQTYTLYASVTPFDDTTIPIDEDDETVTGNNSAFKTFTVLEPQGTINVPDAPPWMSVVMALVVLGWLFASARKETDE
ncbi:MAG: hypothetical protein AABW68_04270 [archaeon]